jgi:hypothetical protein
MDAVVWGSAATSPRRTGWVPAAREGTALKNSKSSAVEQGSGCVRRAPMDGKPSLAAPVARAWTKGQQRKSPRFRAGFLRGNAG